jgi:acetyl esterase/lipase
MPTIGARVLALLAPVAGALQPVMRWPSSLHAHVSRGIGKALAESAEQDGVLAGGRSALRMVSLLVNQLFIFPLSMVPWYARTAAYTRSVNIARGSSVDVYSEGGTAGGPLVCFVHGGSWGQGAPWQYALLARRFLEDGGASRVAIARYRLFPEGDVDTMVADVAAALEWCREQRDAEAAARGDGAGSQLRVVLAAQSAGAQLCALHLAQIRGTSQYLPDKFVALSGVFDIASHFAHERTRLVHWLSPMWLTMLGRRSLTAAEGGGVPGGFGSQELAAAGLTYDAIARATLRGQRGTPAWDLVEESRITHKWRDADLLAFAAASPTHVLRSTPVADPPVCWPPTVVLHAADDATVPVASAREFVAALRSTLQSRRHAPLRQRPTPPTPQREDEEAVRYQEHERAGHVEIMLSLMSPLPFEELPDIAREFVHYSCTSTD